ncbi:NTP transferase domain-containing protein [Actinomycetota bacterium]
MTTTAIVLAAGASQRMGRPKLLLPHRSTTLLGATVAAVAASRVDRVIIVAGPETATAASALVDARVSAVQNPDPARGNMSSLMTAIDRDQSASFFVIVAGDLPTIAPAAIDAVAEVTRTEHAWAAVATYRDRTAHPFVLSRAAVDELGHLEGSKVLWKVLVEDGDLRVRSVPVDAEAPIDVNTPADYIALTAHHGN